MVKKISDAPKGRPCSEETRKKLSEANRGKKASEETRKKMSAAQMGNTYALGYKHTKETRKKISDGNKGKTRSEETRKKMSAAQMGNTKGLGSKHSKETRKKQSESAKNRPPTPEDVRKKLSESAKTRPPISEDTRKKISAVSQGIPYDEWEAYACEKTYCPKFNEACRESCREKYGRRCFICNKTEKANGQKLSVHHVDMDKAQGCESNWKLVPLCIHCHATAHNDEIIARLGYILRR